ncbi:MAG: pyridoxal-phosphate dependent enzyme [Cyclobacteriaceae bacterium]
MAIIPSPLEQIKNPLFEEKELEVWIKRDDLIHPTIMGNKWRKLKYNLEFAKKERYEGVLTFGGAYSNHIAATAAACYEHSLPSIGIIRGEELNADSNATLRFASNHGMHLEFINREAYRNVRSNPDAYELRTQGNYYRLPEGGTNGMAIKGCAEIIRELPDSFDFITTPLGTGGTMAGLLKGMEGNGMLLGFSSLKGAFVRNDFQKLIDSQHINFSNFKILTDYHFGGYAKVPDDLIAFINRTKAKFDLQFDPIYNGKMYFGVLKLIDQDYFRRKSKILVLHTGGLQGVSAFNDHRNQIALH